MRGKGGAGRAATLGKLRDLKLLASTFGLIFLAELGDKTQLATLAIAASERSRLTVFLGSAAALVLTSAIAAVLGEAVVRTIPPVWIQRVAGVAFIAMGVLFLVGHEWIGPLTSTRDALGSRCPTRCSPPAH